MKTEDVQNCKVEREGWGDGPWDGEPDRVDFHHAGFACLLLRNRSGAWCGYVGVPSTHADYGKDYNDVNVEVHGGLTYGEKCDGMRICHVPAPGEPDDLFWFGFDCLHCWDVAPGYEAINKKIGLGPMRDEGAAYRTVQYARNQTESLAEQLASAPKPDAVDPVDGVVTG